MDRNDFQGKRKDQVEFSYKMASISLVLLILTLIVIIIG